MPHPEWSLDAGDEAFLQSAAAAAAVSAVANGSSGVAIVPGTSRALAQSSVAAVVLGQAHGEALFFKRACVAELQRKSPRNPEAKWRVTLGSFVNEAAFLRAGAVRGALEAAALRTPRVVAVGVGVDGGGADAASGEPGFASVFRILTERLDLGGSVVEHRFLDEPQATALVVWLARFHSVFFFKSGSVEWRSQWERGGWWRKPLRPTVKFDAIPAAWEHLAAQFPAAFQAHERTSSADVPDLLEKMRDCAASDAFARALGPSNTIMHGDVKTCNAFFDAAKQGEVVVIDFQWTGPARGGVADVVYLVFGGVRLPHMDVDVAALASTQAEQSRAVVREFHAAADALYARLLEAYVAAATPALYNAVADAVATTTRGSGSTPRDELTRLADLELLDYFSTALPYLLSDLTPKIALRNRAKYGFLTYEESALALAWFCGRAMDAMRRFVSSSAAV